MFNSLKSLVSRRKVMLAMVGAGMTFGFGQSVQAQQGNERLALEGYCAVCVIDAHKWEKGSPSITSIYDGLTYRFPNAAIKGKFDANPTKYVPALGGDCTVCLAKAGKRAPGNIRHASLHKNRLFLFPSAAEKAVFDKNPTEYENVDLAADGECIVCLVKANKHVPGSTKFTEIHNGLRYLFPSPGEAAEFRRAPQKYVAAGKGKMMQEESRVGQATPRRDNRVVTISGMSACAGCEFGVTPLGNPEELGLAVKTSNGNIVVVERAHELYPTIYKARFEGQNIKVSGKLLKTDGKVAWLKPSSVQVIN